MMPEDFLPNPEHDWDPPAKTRSVEPYEVERRIGATSESLEVLSGGLANLNVRVGAEKVLRIYRRDRRALAREAALLARPWRSFRVPKVLDAGEDFLLLEYVPHTRVRGGAVQGAAIGEALAEIHATHYPEPGFLDPELRVDLSLGEAVEALVDHAGAQIETMSPEMAAGLAPAFDRFLATHREEMGELARKSVLLHGDFKASNLHWTDDDRLLVLDWEFAWAGPPLMDIGQLIRWGPERSFLDAFEECYLRHDGHLAGNWRRWAAAFDIFNLVGLLAAAAPGSRRAIDVRRGMDTTFAEFS